MYAPSSVATHPCKLGLLLIGLVELITKRHKVVRELGGRYREGVVYDYA